jgi:hypothetical protein
MGVKTVQVRFRLINSDDIATTNALMYPELYSNGVCVLKMFSSDTCPALKGQF